MDQSQQNEDVVATKEMTSNQDVQKPGGSSCVVKTKQDSKTEETPVKDPVRGDTEGDKPKSTDDIIEVTADNNILGEQKELRVKREGANNYGGKRGVVLVGVHKDGTGDKQGLKKDDLILAVNGKKVITSSEVYKLY